MTRSGSTTPLIPDDAPGYGRTIAIAVVAVTYSVAMIALHGPAGKPLDAAQRAVGFDMSHLILAVFGFISGGLVLWYAGRFLRHDIQRGIYLRLGGFIGVGCVMAYSLLMVKGIELVHFLQYGILAMLLCHVVRSRFRVIALVLIVGLVDEIVQHYVTFVWRHYLDFNDLILNGIGAWIGVWLFTLLPGRNRETWTVHKADIPVWTGLFLLVVVFFSIGLLTMFEQVDGIPMVRRPAPTVEDPFPIIRSTEWGNTWIWIHPYVGMVVTFLMPFGALLLPRNNGSRIVD